MLNVLASDRVNANIYPYKLWSLRLFLLEIFRAHHVGKPLLLLLPKRLVWWKEGRGNA
jgi:hypothetical protein